MLESLVLQVTNITQGVIPVGSDPNLGTVAYIVTTAGTTVGIVITFLKSKQWADFSGMLGMIGIRKGTEAKQAVVKSLTEADKEELVERLKTEVKTGILQEESQIAKKPEINPNKIEDLPREKFDTKPKV